MSSWLLQLRFNKLKETHQFRKNEDLLCYKFEFRDHSSTVQYNFLQLNIINIIKKIHGYHLFWLSCMFFMLLYVSPLEVVHETNMTLIVLEHQVFHSINCIAPHYICVLHVTSKARKLTVPSISMLMKDTLF